MWTVFLFGCERPNANIQFPAMTECPLMAQSCRSSLVQSTKSALTALSGDRHAPDSDAP